MSTPGQSAARSSLARPIDPNYLSNRLIVVFTVATFLVMTGFRLLIRWPVLDSIFFGLGAGLAVFLAWACARELDPDYNLSAYIAAPCALAAVLLLGLPNLWTVFLMLLLARVVERTVGPPVALLDAVGILVLMGIVVYQRYVFLGAITALALLLDNRLHAPNRPILLFSGLAVVLTVVLALLRGIAPYSGLEGVWLAIVGVIAVLFALVALIQRWPLQSVADQTGEPLDARRVQAGRLLELAGALGMALWSGAVGMIALLPLWTAFIGVILNRLAMIRKAPART